MRREGEGVESLIKTLDVSIEIIQTVVWIFRLCNQRLTLISNFSDVKSAHSGLEVFARANFERDCRGPAATLATAESSCGEVALNSVIVLYPRIFRYTQECQRLVFSADKYFDDRGPYR